MRIKVQHEDSYMWGHTLSHHQGRRDVKYKFVIVKTFQKALIRQISEAVSLTFKPLWGF